MKKVGCIVLLSFCLSGCSSFYSSNGEDQYMTSRNGLLLVVPPPLTRSNIGDFYDLPVQNQNVRVSIAPPA